MGCCFGASGSDAGTLHHEYPSWGPNPNRNEPSELAYPSASNDSMKVHPERLHFQDADES